MNDYSLESVHVTRKTSENLILKKHQIAHVHASQEVSSDHTSFSLNCVLILLFVFAISKKRTEAQSKSNDNKITIFGVLCLKKKYLQKKEKVLVYCALVSGKEKKLG